MTAWDTATAPRSLVYVVMLEALFDGETARFHTGVGPISWDDAIWHGMGQLGGLSPITAGEDLEAGAINVTLSGVPSDYRAYVLNTLARGRRVNVYDALIDHATGIWSSEPELEYAGFIDRARLVDSADDGGGATVSIEVGIISAMAYVRRYTVARATLAYHQRLYPGDMFFSFKTNLRTPLPTPDGPVNGGANGGSSPYANGRGIRWK